MAGEEKHVEIVPGLVLAVVAQGVLSYFVGGVGRAIGFAVVFLGYLALSLRR